MSIEDLRGDWPCAWCDCKSVAKRGTICATCEVKLTAGRASQLDRQTQLPLEDPASFGSVIAFRGMDTIVDPKGRI